MGEDISESENIGKVNKRVELETVNIKHNK